MELQVGENINEKIIAETEVPLLCVSKQNHTTHITCIDTRTYTKCILSIKPHISKSGYTKSFEVFR